MRIFSRISLLALSLVTILATAVIPAQAQSDWMTEEFVPFKAMLEFSAPTTATGTLVLEKDNPSGLPENADSLIVPVKFR